MATDVSRKNSKFFSHCAQVCHSVARLEMVAGNYIFFRCTGRLPGWIRFLIVSITIIKAIPLEVWTGPEGSRRLRLPDFKTIST